MMVEILEDRKEQNDILWYVGVIGIIVELYNEDCLMGMNRIPNESVDMVLCDLPYGTTACKWDSVLSFDKLWEHYNRVIKPNGAIALFGSEPFSSYLRLSNIKMFRYDWIWHKNFSGGFATARRQPMKYHEIISVFYKAQPTYNPQFQEYADSVKTRFKEGDMVNRTKEAINPTNKINGGLGYEGEQSISFTRGKYPESVQKFDGVPNCNGIRVHPTQKPVPLLEYLINTYTNKNETILDNCMGSGSTGVAAINAHRNFIGFELDSTYYEVAKNRMNKHIIDSNMQDLYTETA